MTSRRAGGRGVLYRLACRLYLGWLRLRRLKSVRVRVGPFTVRLVRYPTVTPITRDR